MVAVSLFLCTWLRLMVVGTLLTTSTLASSSPPASPPALASTSNAKQQAFAQAIVTNNTNAAAQAIANVDAQTLGGAITQAGGLVDNDLSLTFDNEATLAGQIATAISQARLPPQVALQGYAYALSYSQNDFTAEAVLKAVMSEGQLTPLLTQAKGLGVDAAEISGIITGQGLLNHDQRIQVAIAASDIFGASAQSLQQASGNVSVIADKIGNTAMLARAGGYPVATFIGSGIPFNAPNDQKFAQMMVMALDQAAVSPDIQGQAFAQALTQALNTGEFSEAADIIIVAAIEANQINSITEGFAQAEPEPTDPTHCQQQVFAEKISQEVGQVTAAARQSVYGQAAADAAKNCPTSP